jgi:ABC-2 type transport system ATP-binding protein
VRSAYGNGTLNEEEEDLRLEIEQVSKQYRGGKLALSNFTLTLEPGVHGLLGPNGAGKSTLMNVLATLTRPTTGVVRWDGVDIARNPDALRGVLGYLPQDFGVYPNLTAVEFLEYLAAVKGLDRATARRRIDELLSLLNLDSARKRAVGGFSGGMKQRVGIAQALLNDPQLLIVDEPTAGLDPEERVRFRSLLTELPGERIVILSTHIVSDVEATATHIALIANGLLLAHSTPESLVAGAEGRVWEGVAPAGMLNALRQKYVICGTIRRGEQMQVRLLAGEAPAEFGATAHMATATLEDAYLIAMASSRAGVGAAA